MSRTAIFLAALLVPVAASAQQSPFAGDMPADRQSAPLEFAAPVYLDPGVSVETGAGVLETAGRGDTGLSRAVAAGLEAVLPAGVSLIAAGADAGVVGVGERPAGGQRPGGIDREQAGSLGGLERAPDPTPRRVERVIVHYPVAFDAIPVSKYADATAFVDTTGTVELLRTRNLPTSLDAGTPTVAAEAALAAAVSDAGAWAAEAAREGPALEVWVGPDGAGRLSYRIELVDNGAAPQARRYWIAATGAPEVIFWESMIHFQHAGSVTGTIWSGADTAGATARQPMPYMDVSRLSGGTATTGAGGLYAFTAGDGTATLSGALSGPNVVIENMAGPVLQRLGEGTPDHAVDLNFNAGTAEELAQTTAFYWANRGHDLAAGILDPADLAALPTIVNRPGQCNAFWNGTSLNFYVAGGSCPNMAYGSVVLHEYGHGVDARKGGIVDGGYSEGFGDAMAILGTGESCVGRDVFGAGTCLRDAAEIVPWPPAPEEGIHARGRRYAGFVWELSRQLGALYGEETGVRVARDLVMGAAKANPADIPDAVHLSFVVDDDDGDLTNGTPHFAALAAAADSRTLPRPPDPAASEQRMGFAWANDPATASYAPFAPYAYNSAGQPIVAARFGPGRYTMTFRGLGGGATAGGHVQVSGYGSSANQCKVMWWSSTGADFVATVQCHGPDGAPADDRYAIFVTWP